MSHSCQFSTTLNGAPREVTIDSRLLLVEAVRILGATGARIGCLTGDCGACTILLDGKVTKSCIVLAASACGAQIITIEGHDDPISTHLKRAFVEKNGFQCGYCTSGMIITAAQALAANATMSDVEIRESISGNLCRCTGYDEIVRAIRAAIASLQGDNSEIAEA